MLEWVIAIRLIGIGHVEIHQIVATVLRDGRGNLLDEIAMRIDHSQPLSIADVLKEEGQQQVGLAGAGLADHIGMEQAVPPPDAE